MSIQVVLDSAKSFGLPLRNTFRGIDVRTGVLIQGPSGWAEFAPFDDYDDQISGRWLAAALEQAFGQWPQAHRQEIPINGILPMVNPETTKVLTLDILECGIKTIKIKVNDGSQHALENDIARINAVRSVAGPNALLRIDVNGSWTLAQAATAIKEIISATGPVEYVEQPCRTLDELVELRRVLNGLTRIAVDESIRLAEKVQPDAIRAAADVVIIKSIPVGGVHAALRIINDIELPVVVSGSLDTSVGLASGLQLAGCVDQLYGACGLGTGMLFTADIVKEPSLPVQGLIPVGRVKPDPTLLEQYQASADVTSAWKERIVRAWNASAIHLVSDDVRKAVTA